MLVSDSINIKPLEYSVQGNYIELHYNFNNRASIDKQRIAA